MKFLIGSLFTIQKYCEDVEYMKYKIKIMSEEEAVHFYENYKSENKYLLISISDKEGDLNFIPRENIEVHQWYFADIEEDIVIPGIAPMSYRQAEEIKTVVCKAVHENITNIIIHCYAGISRSGAVGCVIAKYLNGDDMYLWKQGRIAPNRWVYKLMCSAFDIEYSDKDFRCRQKISEQIVNMRLREYGINISNMFPQI